MLSGLSDLSDISGITELKAQLRAKEQKPALMKIDENEELKPSQSEMQMITTGELELGYKNLKSPEVILDENDKTYGLTTKD